MLRKVEAFVACLALIFSVAVAAHARATFRSEERPARSSGPRERDRKEPSQGRPSAATQLFEACADDPLSAVVRREYGAMFAADRKKVALPKGCVFRDGAQVTQFQNRAAVGTVTIGDVRVALQSEALAAFLVARQEARRQRLDITPTGPDASRRSYAQVAALWEGQLSQALAYWVKRGRLTPRNAERLRDLSASEQVLEVLRLEKAKLFFGQGFDKPILESVAAPGTSQHLTMLALDVEEHENPRVREILAKHGWFQTIRNDLPHFTYLGVREADLNSLGLRKESIRGRTVWTADPAAATEARQQRPAPRAKAAKPRGKAKATDGQSVFTAIDERNFTVSTGILMTASARALARKLAENYFKLTGRRLHFTSGFRTPDRQALAMFNMLEAFGVQHYKKVYRRRRRPAGQILIAYLKSQSDRALAIGAMARTIKRQMRNGIYVSNHLREHAFDVRASARRNSLESAAAKLGGRVGFEANHFHVEL